MNSNKFYIQDMDEELQRTLKGNDQLELAITDKNLRIETQTKEVKQLRYNFFKMFSLSTIRHSIGEKEKFIKLFVEDLHKLYTSTDSSEWRVGLKQM